MNTYGLDPEYVARIMAMDPGKTPHICDSSGEKDWLGRYTCVWCGEKFRKRAARPDPNYDSSHVVDIPETFYGI